ncbi:MAG: hypothetical protein PHR24_06310, partial [Oscillospiraceae bacterium]|nr:hypothetical protein [Oscillospiraceae bacterium]
VVEEPAEVAVPDSVVLKVSAHTSDIDWDHGDTLPVVVPAVVVGSSFVKSQCERGRHEVIKRDIINNINIVLMCRIIWHLSAK